MRKSVKSKRILAFIVDWCIVFGICAAVATWGESATYDGELHFNTFRLILAVVLYLALPIFRDLLIRNRSLGKFFIGLEVIDGDGNKPNVVRLILRNIFSVFPFIDFVLLVGTDDGTLGDRISKTYVIKKTRMV